MFIHTRGLHILAIVVCTNRRILITRRGLEDCVATIETGHSRTKPSSTHHFRCYPDHYETRTTTTTDSKGNTRTSTHQEKVTTHRASKTYNLPGWQDDSPPPKPTSHNVCKVKYKRHFRWGNTHAQAKHDGEFAAWVSLNDRDTHKSVSWTWDLAGFSACVTPPPRPTCIHTCAFLMNSRRRLNSLLLVVLYVFSSSKCTEFRDVM